MVGTRAVALIGCGPRGLGVLERLVHHLTAEPGPEVTVYLIDPGLLGCGVHDRAQPDYLLLNTVAAELTAFVDSAMVPGGGVPGPSLYEWWRERDPGARPDEHLPRRVLGAYLSWAADRLIAAAPERLRVHHCAATAIGVRPLPGNHELVTLDSGEQLRVRHVVLCTGHTGSPVPAAPDDAGAHRWIGAPYPLPDRLSRISSGDTVGLLGTGLTAMDVIAALTVGRGGRFDRSGYRRSGREPRIVLANRTGLPALARPKPHVVRTGPPARHLTTAALDLLRASSPDGRLDLDRDVLLLVEKEIRYRYEWLSRHADSSARISGLLTALRELTEDRLPTIGLIDAAAYARWFTARIRGDLEQARAGLDRSAEKFALEVLRAGRDQLRAVVDGAGVSDPSAFFGRFAAAVNRTVIGPQAERNAELLALHQAGVVVLGAGPAPAVAWHADHWTLSSTRLDTPVSYELDWLIAARTPQPRAGAGTNPVLRDLAAQGRLTDGPVGAELDRAGCPVGADGSTHDTLRVFGPLAEGTSYYNHYVPSPGTPSRAVLDADRIVREILATELRTERLSA